MKSINCITKIKLERSEELQKEIYEKHNIKQEAEVQFVLILPPANIKIEEEDSPQNENSKVFKCESCGKMCATNLLLWCHKKTHEPKVECPICSIKMYKANLSTHVKRHGRTKKFQCDVCPSNFRDKSSIVQHMWKHKQVDKFKCAKCDRGFNHITKYSEHVLTHDDPRPFKCDLCPAMRKWKTNIHEHMQIAHIKRENKFECNVCKKTFRTLCRLRLHQKVHSAKKNMPCDICGKLFTNKGGITQHKSLSHRKKIHFNVDFLLTNYFFRF